jgi:hypothetical protein
MYRIEAGGEVREGDRIASAQGDRGTVRYVGPVAGQVSFDFKKQGPTPSPQGSNVDLEVQPE